jgi:hypothetical protein
MKKRKKMICHQYHFSDWYEWLYKLVTFESRLLIPWKLVCNTSLLHEIIFLQQKLQSYTNQSSCLQPFHLFSVFLSVFNYFLQPLCTYSFNMFFLGVSIVLYPLSFISVILKKKHVTSWLLYETYFSWH